MASIIDLHIHSNFSDGELTPYAIIDEAVKNNVKVISITDHDSVEAYTKEVMQYAKQKGLLLISGVEMSTRLETGFHVLGYNIDIKNTKLLQTLSMLRNARLDYLNNVAVKLRDLGYILDTDSLASLPTVTKAHISRQIVGNEANKNLLMKVFGHIPSMGEFIEAIMNDGCPAFVRKFSITPIEASKIIHEAGGLVVLAHPIAYAYEDGVGVEQIALIIKEMNADGIEGNYIYVDAKGNVYNEVDFWNRFATQNDVFSSVGSDFHNINPKYCAIGFVNTDFELSATQTQKILEKIIKQ